MNILLLLLALFMAPVYTAWAEDGEKLYYSGPQVNRTPQLHLGKLVYIFIRSQGSLVANAFDSDGKVIKTCDCIERLRNYNGTFAEEFIYTVTKIDADTKTYELTNVNTAATISATLNECGKFEMGGIEYYLNYALENPLDKNNGMEINCDNYGKSWKTYGFANNFAIHPEEGEGQYIEVYAVTGYTDTEVTLQLSHQEYYKGQQGYLMHPNSNIIENTFYIRNEDYETLSIPADNVFTPETNLLKTVTEDTHIPASYTDGDKTYYNYIFSDGAFYRVRDEGDDVKLPAGKAYLSIERSGGTASAPAKLNIAIDGTTTGIQAIPSDATKLTDGTLQTDPCKQTALYNLAGQRVSPSYRGIVIKNGHKYLVK